MLKESKKINKILAMILLIIILFATIQPIVLAANQEISGSRQWLFRR